MTHLDDERFHSCQSSRYGLDHAHDGFHFGTTTGRFRHVGHSREEETMEKRAGAYHRALSVTTRTKTLGFAEERVRATMAVAHWQFGQVT